MIQITVKAVVPNATTSSVIDFFINCTDQKYSAWWPGEHIQFHTFKRLDSVIGNRVFFDEFVGRKRLKFKAVITQYDPTYRIEYRMTKWGLGLPAWVDMRFTQMGDNVEVSHSLCVGFSGVGRVLDFAIRPFITQQFVQDLERHAREEFPRLTTHINK